ncbi:hypothetical protein BX667DRAFT_123122 [Coemansia mojavensis]|nr:hypothetical protein BX667DRAFT_123122 [Coemansia mojavensis]
MPSLQSGPPKAPASRCPLKSRIASRHHSHRATVAFPCGPPLQVAARPDCPPQKPKLPLGCLQFALSSSPSSCILGGCACQSVPRKSKLRRNFFCMRVLHPPPEYACPLPPSTPRPTRCPRAPCHAPPAHFACPTRLRAPFAHPPCGNALFCHPPNRAVFAPGPTAARLATNAPRLARPTATNHSRPHFAVFANMPIPPIVAFFHEPTNCCPPCDQRVPPCATNRHQPFPPALCRFCQHAHPANRCLFPGADQLWPALRPPCPALQPPWPALFRKPRARTCKKKKKNFHKSVLFE